TIMSKDQYKLFVPQNAWTLLHFHWLSLAVVCMESGNPNWQLDAPEFALPKLGQLGHGFANIDTSWSAKTMRAMGLLLLLALVPAALGWVNDEALRQSTGRRVGVAPRRLTVDLDLPAQQRWSFLASDPAFQNYKEEVNAYLEKYVPSALLPLVDSITKSLTGAFYSDYAAEMRSIAGALKLSLGEVVLVNLIYQLEDLGTSCSQVNTTGPCGPGLCTGLVADGSSGVWQGRNLDWNLDARLLPYVVEVDYKSRNLTVFSAVQVVGMIGVLHGVSLGNFSVQLNARDQGGSALLNLLEELLLGGKSPTHVLRRALEQSRGFTAAEQFLLSERLANPAYFILAGAGDGEGAILTRGRTFGNSWRLHEKNAKDVHQINQQPDWLRLQTNYDSWTAVPDYDNRRAPGVNNTEKFCKDEVSEDTVWSVMTTWPTKNHHTDITSVMHGGDCAADHSGDGPSGAGGVTGAQTGGKFGLTCKEGSGVNQPCDPETWFAALQTTRARSEHQNFRPSDAQGSDRFSYTVMGSMLELYCNAVVDLLAKGSSRNPGKPKVRDGEDEERQEKESNTAAELSALMERRFGHVELADSISGNDQRTVAATAGAMNSESSRSHLVLIIKIISVNKRETKEVLKGKMLMCDLAGSERLKKSEVTEHQQKEAIEINKSLTALGDVIEALTKGGKGVVPYRNHKLTQLMQDSLGGSAKTLMFVNCSPASSNLDETFMPSRSLKYAQRAKKITNTATKKPVPRKPRVSIVVFRAVTVSNTCPMGPKFMHAPPADQTAKAKVSFTVGAVGDSHSAETALKGQDLSTTRLRHGAMPFRILGHITLRGGWTLDRAQSLFMVVQEWKSAEALEEHVRSAAAQRFDRDLKDGDMLACAPNLSLFGKELSAPVSPDLSTPMGDRRVVQELRAIAAEARASGQEEEEAYSPPAPAAQAAQAAQATSGSMTASKGYRKAAAKEKSSGRGNSRAWK
ncbi:unnamed protein product, partial [Effrenium voratum]